MTTPKPRKPLPPPDLMGPPGGRNEGHLMKTRKTISERFPAALAASMIEIAIFPRSKMAITIKDGGRHPPLSKQKSAT
jgi:hypothetical protein